MEQDIEDVYFTGESTWETMSFNSIGTVPDISLDFSGYSFIDRVFLVPRFIFTGKANLRVKKQNKRAKLLSLLHLASRQNVKHFLARLFSILRGRKNVSNR